MKLSLKIAIVEPSVMVRTGLGTLLRKLSGMQITVVEILEVESLLESLRIHKPDVLIACPQLLLHHSFHRLREESAQAEMKIIALMTSLCPMSLLRMFDEQISLYDTPEQIREKLERLIAASGDDGSVENGEEQQSLSAREKEIVICVVKGMTNREIADKLFLSAHTVITHRRNIARKLQIHSPSGLTIYAIVNKLVELKDIKQ